MVVKSPNAATAVSGVGEDSGAASVIEHPARRVQASATTIERNHWDTGKKYHHDHRKSHP